MIAKDLEDYKGFFPANPTPVVDGEGIKEDALRAILEYNIENGAGGFWLAGTTGEGPILSERQRRETAEVSADVCKGKVKTIMHVGGITTELSIAGAKAAKDAGCDSICLLPPFLYPTDEQGVLDVYFLEFNELEKGIDDYMDEDCVARCDEYSSLDIDALNVDLLRDVLDVVEALDKKVRGASSDGASGNIGSFRVDGAVQGLNQDSQYNVFIEDEKLILFRDVNGVIEIAFDSGSNVYLETIVEGYEGIILIGDGDDSRIIINQSN